MFDDEKRNSNEKKNGDFKVPPRTWIVWIAILGAIPLLMMFRDRTETTVASRLDQDLDRGRAVG